MAEESKHLTYFKVENFKCFDSFEMEDIGQFNLILGDNNVGKTSVLEALLFDENPVQYLYNLLSVLDKKKIEIYNKDDINEDGIEEINYLGFFFNRLVDLKKEIYFTPQYLNQVKCVRFEIKYRRYNELENDEKQQLEARYGYTRPKRVAVLVNTTTHNKKIADLKIDENEDDVNQEIPIVYPHDGYSSNLIGKYTDNIEKSKKRQKEFANSLKSFIPDLENVATTLILESPIIVNWLTNLDSYIPLAMYGEGTIKLFRILVEIINNSNNRLMIDEIDSGIHYSRFKDYWRTIIKSAANNNVQLFMTTHNIECLRYLKEVLEEEDMKQYQEKTRSYTLQKLPDGHIKAYKYTFEQFEYSLSQDHEIRGSKNG